MVNKRLSMVVLVAGFALSHILHSFGPKTFFAGRSQSVNAMLDMVSWEQEINRSGRQRVCDEVMVYEPAQESAVGQTNNRSVGWLPWRKSSVQAPLSRALHGRKKMVCHDEDAMFTVFSIAPVYARSFDADKIIKALFGERCLTFSGSRSGLRAKTDILSDNFGLPSDFKSIVSFDPVITNFSMDFGWYHGLDAWVPGLFYRVHMPIVHAKWDLKMVEKVINPGSPYNTDEIMVDPTVAPATYPAGYLAQDRILLNSGIPHTVIEAFEGKNVYGDMSNPLRYGKIFGRQTLTRAAEIQLAVGYNFLLTDWYHLGASVRAAAPTGNRSTAEFLFEPIIGNGGHWELGAGFSGHVQAWESGDAWHKIGLYCDLNVTHLFNSKQRRSFDFTNNGPGSRYMLLTNIDSPSQNLTVAGEPNEPAANQYQRRLVPAINQTTLDSNISIAVQADLVFKVAYQRDNLELDLGYNLWARSKEKIDRCQQFESNRFALKGDAQVYGFFSITDVPGMTDVPVPLNATQSGATINAGQKGGNNIEGSTNQYANVNADNPALALNGESGPMEALTAVDGEALYGSGFEPAGVNLSNPAILLQDSDLDICSGLLARAISHKIFTHVNYAWRGEENYTPYLGAGFGVEWASTCAQKNSAYSQWSLWVKGGISY